MNYRFESQLQVSTINKIKEKYGDDVWIFKTHDLCRVGIPDLILCFFGHFVSIELKRKQNAQRKGTMDPRYTDSDASQMQKYNIKKINSAGGSAFIGRTVPEIMERLDKIHQSLKFFEAHR